MSEKDLLAKSKQLDKDIVAMPRDKVFTKRTVVVGFVAVMLGIGAGMAQVRGYARDTNDAVKHEIPGLKEQIADRNETIDDQQSVIQQFTDALVVLFDILRQHGIEPPEIIIKPED